VQKRSSPPSPGVTAQRENWRQMVSLAKVRTRKLEVREVRRVIWLLCVVFGVVLASSAVYASILPPLIPTNPTPADGGILNPEEQNRLTWELGHAGLTTSSLGDIVRYDVFFGKAGQMTLASQNLAEPWFEPDELEPATEYQWQVISRDYNNQVFPGPVWTFTCIQWMQVSVDGTSLYWRILKPDGYAALLCNIIVCSNDAVGLTFGPQMADLTASEGDSIPTWYTFGQNLDEALRLRGWIRAADLAGRSFPGLFPKSDEGTRIEVWGRLEPVECTSAGSLSNDFDLILTLSNP